MNLSEVEFWDNYWCDVNLPSEANMRFSFDRCLSKELKNQLKGVSGEVFEVGCAPGKWLAYLSSVCNLKANGIEYSEPGLKATLNNLKLLNIPSGTVIAGDFFLQKPIQQFDVVISLGFIEHFDNVDGVVDLHLQWLKPGGRLILGVPNFSGITKFIQLVLDKTLLDKHNLKIMNLGYFNRLGERHPLDKVSIKYLGSFEPDLPIPKYKYGNPLQFFVKCFLLIARFLRRFEIFDQFNGPSFSSYILAVYKKRED
jgi:SAM-dependent methyltransferase